MTKNCQLVVPNMLLNSHIIIRNSHISAGVNIPIIHDLVKIVRKLVVVDTFITRPATMLGLTGNC